MSLMYGPDDKDKDLDQGADDKDAGLNVVIEGEEDADDRRLVQGESDDDQEDRRQRNRDARRKRKERHHKLWEENRQLRTMNEGLQKALGDQNTRLTRIEEGSVDNYGRRIEQSLAGAERALEQAKAKLKRAMTDNDADGVVEANEAIAQVTVDRKALLDSKDQFEARREQDRTKDKDDDKGDDRKNGADTGERARFEQTVFKNASVFARRNSWYDHDADDDDTNTVKELDAEVAAEGFNPASRDYWEELEARLKKALPHRFKKTNGKGRDDNRDDEDDDGKDRTVTTSGSGRGPRSGSGSKDYRLSKERVQAIKDAGKWDDPTERSKMIKSYQKYDREHSSKGA